MAVNAGMAIAKRGTAPPLFHVLRLRLLWVFLFFIMKNDGETFTQSSIVFYVLRDVLVCELWVLVSDQDRLYWQMFLLQLDVLPHTPW